MQALLDTSVPIGADDPGAVEGAISAASLREQHLGALVARGDDQRARRALCLDVIESTFEPQPIDAPVAGESGRVAAAVQPRVALPRAALRVREERQQARRYAMAVTPARTVREAMHEGCECIRESQSLLDAAKRMEELDVGVLPICGDDDRLKGMLTDRDIVVKALAQRRDPATTKCGEFAQGKVRCVAADASLDDALSMMREHAVKRLCVLDDSKRLCGIITEGDIATHTAQEQTGELVEAIASSPPQHF